MFSNIAGARFASRRSDNHDSRHTLQIPASHGASLPTFHAQAGTMSAPGDRQRESFSDRARRMSRFSTVSATPTAVDLTAGPPPFASTAPSEPKRPSFKEVAKKHPRNIVYLSILTLLFVGGAVGWALYQTIGVRSRGDGYRGGLVVNGMFVIVLIVVFLLAIRQCLFIYRLFQPIALNQTPSLPPWLVGRPPTYREALRTSGASRGTGDVEDGYIAQNESLPKYGEYTGSTLLARSQSRGGSAPPEDRAGGDVGMVDLTRGQAASGEVAVSGERAVRMEGEDAVARETRLREEREHEMRQVAEARRLQLGSVETRQGAAEPQVAREGSVAEREKWEEVPLETRV